MCQQSTAAPCWTCRASKASLFRLGLLQHDELHLFGRLITKWSIQNCCKIDDVCCNYWKPRSIILRRILSSLRWKSALILVKGFRLRVSSLCFSNSNSAGTHLLLLENRNSMLSSSGHVMFFCCSHCRSKIGQVLSWSNRSCFNNWLSNESVNFSLVNGTDLSDVL